MNSARSAVPSSRLESVTFFLPGGIPTKREINLYDGVFDPADPWGELFRRALSRLDLRGKRVADLGAGSGACAVQMCMSGPPQELYLVEMIRAFLALACHNVSAWQKGLPRAKCPTFGAVTQDAVDFLNVTPSGRFDYIVACLPQVPGWEHELGDPAARAHLYDPNRHPLLPQWGLGLLHDVKRLARDVLAPGGRLVLVHSGRVPERARRELDEQVGYREIRVLDETMVRHHPGTPLRYLCGEGKGFLFTDPEGRESITPEQAENCRIAFETGRIAESDYRVYHRLFVVESEPIW